MIRHIEIPTDDFDSVYKNNNLALFIKKMDMPKFNFGPNQTIQFSNPENKQTFVAVIELVESLQRKSVYPTDNLPDVIWLGEVIRDIPVIPDSTMNHPSSKPLKYDCFAYYKQFNGRGYWVKVSKELFMANQPPAMLMNPNGPGGKMLLISNSLVFTEERPPREGMMTIGSDLVLKTIDGHYKNLLNR